MFLQRYENYRQTYSAAFENSFEALGNSLEIFEEDAQEALQPIPVLYKANESYLPASRSYSNPPTEVTVVVISADDSDLTNLKKFNVDRDAVELLEPDKNDLNFNVIVDLSTLAKQAVDLISAKIQSNWTIRLITSADHDRTTVIESSRSVIHFFDAGVLLFLTIANHFSKQALLWLREVQIKEIVLISHSNYSKLT